MRRTPEEIAYDIKTKTKVCTECNKRKSFDDFHLVNKSVSRDERRSHCKACNVTRGRRYRATEKKKKPEQYKERILKGNLCKFGLTLEDYDKMYEAQDGKCKICGTSKSRAYNTDRLSVDHDHATGKVRGLLCGHCNKALGLFKDNEESLLAAIKYLRETGE